MPGGWSGTSATNSITVTAGINGGTIEVRANNHCGNSIPQTRLIIVNALPVIAYTQNPDVTCLNYDGFTLGSVSPLGGTFGGTGVVGADFHPGIAGIGMHEITYSYTDGNGCTAEQNQLITVNACLSLHQNENPTIAVFPNPFQEEFTIEFTQNGKHTVNLLNILGQMVTNFQTDQSSTVLRTSNLSAGIYYIVIVEDNVCIKLIKN